VLDNENATTNESETGGSRRLSENYQEVVEEEEELAITAEEIERLMMFDMMRQNFKFDDKIGASSSARNLEQDGNNNNISVERKDPPD
jgi:hypothetical protein